MLSVTELKEFVAGIRWIKFRAISNFVPHATETESVKFTSVSIKSFIHMECSNISSNNFAGFNSNSIGKSERLHYLAARSDWYRQRIFEGEVQALQCTRNDSLITESSLYNLAIAFDSHPSESTTDSISSRRGSMYSGCDAMSNNRWVMPLS